MHDEPVQLVMSIKFCTQKSGLISLTTPIMHLQASSRKPTLSLGDKFCNYFKQQSETKNRREGTTNGNIKATGTLALEKKKNEMSRVYWPINPVGSWKVRGWDEITLKRVPNYRSSLFRGRVPARKSWLLIPIRSPGGNWAPEQVTKRLEKTWLVSGQTLVTTEAGILGFKTEKKN